jgi:hypothetical protein
MSVGHELDFILQFATVLDLDFLMFGIGIFIILTPVQFINILGSVDS